MVGPRAGSQWCCRLQNRCRGEQADTPPTAFATWVPHAQLRKVGLLQHAAPRDARVLTPRFPAHPLSLGWAVPSLEPRPHPLGRATWADEQRHRLISSAWDIARGVHVRGVSTRPREPASLPGSLLRCPRGGFGFCLPVSWTCCVQPWVAVEAGPPQFAGDHVMGSLG